MSGPTSAVVFDLGGVLTVPVFAETERYGDELGLSKGTLSAYFRGDPVFSAVERGEVTFRDFLKDVGRRVQEHHGIRLDLRRLAGAAEAGGHLDPSMMSLVRDLHGRGILVGLLTNNVREARIWREELPHDLFEVVVDSSEVGLRKPEPAIYEHLLARLGCAAGEVTYVDDFEENLPPAAALGMRTLHFTDARSCRELLLGVPEEVR